VLIADRPARRMPHGWLVRTDYREPVSVEAGPAADSSADGAVRRYGARHRFAGGAAALLAAAGLWGVWRLAIAGPSVRHADVVALAGAGLEGTGSTWGAHLWSVARPILGIVSIRFVVVAVVIACLFALYRKRFVLTVQLALLVGGANVTTQLLKSGISRTDLGLGDSLLNSWPSGHTTVAASVSMALTLAVPRRLRPAAIVLGVVYTTATGVGTMIGGWHRASDVIGAVLVVLAWAGLVTALDGRLEPGHRPKTARATRTVIALLGGMAVVAGATAALALDRTLGLGVAVLHSRADLLIAFAGGAVGVAAVCCLAFAMLGALLALADDDAV